MLKLRKGQMIIINNNTYLRKERESWADFSGEEKPLLSESKNRTILILGKNPSNKKFIATSTTSGKKLKNGRRYYPPEFAYHDSKGKTFIKFQVIEFESRDIEGKFKHFRRLNNDQLNIFLNKFKERNVNLYKYYLNLLKENES